MTRTIADIPVIDVDRLVRRYGHTDAVNGLDLARQARPLLRLLRPQRRRQDHDDQVPAEPAAPNERHGARLRARSAHGRGGRQVAPRLRARLRRVLSVDDRARHARLLRGSFRARWNRATERALLDRFRLDTRQKTSAPVEGPAHAARADHGDLRRARAARARRADRRASIRSCAASSSRPSSAPTRKAIRAGGPCSSRRT